VHSFRWRIALSSALIQGLVLLAFGAVAWWSLNRSRIADLDAELRHFGYRVALRTSRNVDVGRLEGSLIDVFGSEKAADRFFVLLTSDGTVLARSSGWPGSLDAAAFPPGEVPLVPQPKGEDIRAAPRDRSPPPPRTVMEPRFYRARAAGGPVRLGVFANPETVLVIGADLGRVADDMRQLRQAFLVALPGALLIMALGAAWVARRALRPVEALGEDMRRVSARSLDQRIEAGGADREFATIIENYNAMLERLERSFAQAIRFSADVSHELKTPLAVMQATLERGLKDCADDERAQAVFAQALEQTGKQRSILESLLLLSRADAGRLEISASRIDLSAMLGTWLEDAELLAEGRGILVRTEIEPGIWIDGDLVLLQRVAHNLFSNAVRYNRHGGEIVCRLARAGGRVDWTVANTGEPVPETDRERVFERFFRRHSVRDGEVGSGLGLSLVREIIAAHGGEVGFGIDEAGRNVVRVRLNVADLSRIAAP
jgi:signal transduction histidine kinase